MHDLSSNEDEGDSPVIERVSTGVNRRDVLQAFAAAGIISTGAAESATAATDTGHGRELYAAGDSTAFENALVFQHKLNNENRWGNPEDTTGNIDGERGGGAVERENNLKFNVEARRGVVLQFRGVSQDNKGGSYNVPLDRLPEPNGQAITWSVWIRPWGNEQWHTFVSRSLGFGFGIHNKRLQAFGWDGSKKTFTVGVDSDASIVPNWWSHVMATVEPSEGARVFVNGELRGETTDGEFTGFTEKLHEYLGVGWNSQAIDRAGGDSRFQGDMSDLRLYLGASADTQDATRVYDATHHGSAQHGKAHPEEWDVSVDMTPSELPIGGSEEVDVVVTYDSPRSLAGSKVYGANVYIDEDVGSYNGVTANNDPDADTNSFGEASIQVEDVQEHTGIAVESEHGDVYSRSIPKTGDTSDENQSERDEEQQGEERETGQEQEQEQEDQGNQEREQNQDNEAEKEEGEEQGGSELDVSVSPTVIPEEKTSVTINVSSESDVTALPVTVNGDDIGETVSTGETEITINPDVRGNQEIVVGSSDGVTGSASVFVVNVGIEEMKPVQTVWDAGPIGDDSVESATALVEGKRTSMLSRISYAVGGGDDDTPPAETKYSLEMSVETSSSSNATVSGVDGANTQVVTVSGGENELQRVSDETTEANAEKRFFSQVADTNPPTGHIEVERSGVSADAILNGEVTLTVTASVGSEEKTVLAEKKTPVELVDVAPIELHFYRMHDEEAFADVDDVYGVLGYRGIKQDAPEITFDKTIDYAVRYLKQVYPIPEDKITVKRSDKTLNARDNGGSLLQSVLQLDNSVNHNSTVSNGRVFPIGVCPASYLTHIRGRSTSGFTDGVTNWNGNAVILSEYEYTTLSHEIAHVLANLHASQTAPEDLKSKAGLGPKSQKEEYNIIPDAYSGNQTLNGYSPFSHEVVAESPGGDTDPYHGESFMNGEQDCKQMSDDGRDKLHVNRGTPPVWVSNTDDGFDGDRQDYDVLLETLNDDAGVDDVQIQVSREEIVTGRSQDVTVSVTNGVGEAIQNTNVIFGNVKRRGVGTDDRPVLTVTDNAGSEGEELGNTVSVNTGGDGEVTVVIDSTTTGAMTVFADTDETYTVDEQRTLIVSEAGNTVKSQTPSNEETTGESPGGDASDSGTTSENTNGDDGGRDSNADTGREGGDDTASEFISDVTESAIDIVTELLNT